MIKFYLLRRLLVFFLMIGAIHAFAQNRVVTGRVLSEDDGAPLPGVSILEKGTQNGTVTDADGNFSLQASENAVLVFSFVGYASQEVPVAGQSNIQLTLKTDVTALSEIVVIGYGTVEKKDVTGAVAKIDASQLNKGAISNPLLQLSGRAAGVNINQVGSEPGVAPNIRIRGITSLIGGNDPLVVVDGIQGNLNLLNQISPSEIESVEILKDASATAIYGSRGAAGVVLITTKKGTAANTFEYNGVYSTETISKKLNMMSADSYREAAAALGVTGFDKNGNTDWQDEIFQTGYTQNHNIAFGGGTDKLNYRASGTAILQNGIVRNSGSKNFIGSIRTTQRALDDKLTLNYNLNLSTLKRQWNGPTSIGTALSTRPTNPVYDENGDYYYDNTLFAYTNPVARVNEIIDGEETNSLFGSLRADYEVIDGLTASAFGSWRKFDNVYSAYQSRIATYDGRSNNGVAERKTDRTNERLLNLILNYKKDFGKHTVDVSGIYEWQKAIYEGGRVRGINFPNDDLGADALQNAGSYGQGDISSYKNDRTNVSFLGRANYSFDSKYIVTASLRRDGSSVFGANHRWANFPSVSVAWRAIEESFLRDQNLFTDLKLRAGYGVTGNQQGLSPLNSVSLVRNTGNVFFAGQVIRNYAIVQNANPDLRWETKEMYNVGVDFGLIENRLTGTIDYFTGETRDLLFDYAVPVPPFPFNRIKANVGTLTNKGAEVSLSYVALDKGDLKVTVAGNFSAVQTKVKNLTGALPGGEQSQVTDYIYWGGGDVSGVGGTIYMSYLITGESLGTFYLYKHAGVDDSGKQLVDDLNADGTIEEGNISADRYKAGQALPKYYIGFTPSMTYKNFDASLVIRGAYGHKIYNLRRAQLSLLSRVGQYGVLDDAMSTGIRNVADQSATDYWLEDGSFTRLENLSIGYRFNTSSWKLVNSMRLGFVANNLFVITKYKGIDPEIRTDGGSGAGIDGGIYPRTRSFALSLNVMFK